MKTNNELSKIKKCLDLVFARARRYYKKHDRTWSRMQFIEAVATEYGYLRDCNDNFPELPEIDRLWSIAPSFSYPADAIYKMVLSDAESSLQQQG